MTTKEKYDALLKSGMFWELFPNLTGYFSEDEKDFETRLIATKVLNSAKVVKDRIVVFDESNPIEINTVENESIR